VPATPHRLALPSQLLKANACTVQLLNHILIQSLHQGADTGGLLQPTILQLGPHIGESSSEVLRIGDVVDSRGSLLADAQLDIHG
jgi:hypothetical protein